MSVRRATYARPLSALGLLLLEYLAISLWFDARVLHERGGDLALFGYLGDVGAILLVVGAAMIALTGARIRGALEAHAGHASEMPWRALGVHALAYGAFVAASAHVLDPAAASVSDIAIWSWLAFALAVGASWLPVAIPWRALREISAPLLSALAISGLVGVFSWLWGQLSMHAWGLVAPTTIRIVVGLLNWMAPEVVEERSQAIVGTPSFQVIVSPVCSGLEGVGLIAALLTSYIVVERKSLHLGRSFALVPIAVIASFLTNALRIALLVMVGTHISPEIALGGFHSKAGWLFFCLLSLGFVALLRSASFFRSSAPVEIEREPILESAAAPYLVPMLVVLAASLLTGLWSDGFDRLYPLRLCAGAAALWAYRKHYSPQLGRPLPAIGIGVIVFVIWLALARGGDAEPLKAGLSQISRAEALLWLVARALGTVLLIPIVEELAFRGYLLRQMMSRTFSSADTRAVEPAAWLVSSIAFGLLHADWLAGILAGLLFAWAQQRRGRLSDAIIAHGTANTLLLADAWLRGNLGWLA